jgi:hypothetical protein
MRLISSPRQIILFWAYALAKGKYDLTNSKALNLNSSKKFKT